jgi:hypothetical protein
MAKLSKSQKQQLKAADDGLSRFRIVRTRRDSHGYPDLLIEAEDNSEVKFRGWWYEGESASDIRWHTENRDGWGERGDK